MRKLVFRRTDRAGDFNFHRMNQILHSFLTEFCGYIEYVNGKLTVIFHRGYTNVNRKELRERYGRAGYVPFYQRRKKE